MIQLQLQNCKTFLMRHCMSWAQLRWNVMRIYVKSDDAVVGMSSTDHVFDGDVAIGGVGACEDTIIS